MQKVKGIYNGEQVVLLEPVTLRPNTRVEVLIPEQDVADEQAYWQELIALNLIKEVRQRSDRETKFEPVRISDDKPVSETIIEERR